MRIARRTAFAALLAPTTSGAMQAPPTGMRTFTPDHPRSAGTIRALGRQAPAGEGCRCPGGGVSQMTITSTVPD